MMHSLAGQHPPRVIRWGNALAFAVTAWVCFTFAFTPLRTSHDEWWHLKTGQWIVSHGLPRTDIFTYTAENISWYNHEWLSQVLMWGIFRAGDGRVGAEYGGILALVAFKTILIVLAFAGFGFLLTRRMQQPAWAALAAAIAAALARRTFYPRPPFISYLLMAGLLWLFIEWRAGRLRTRHLLPLIPLFVLWSNLHGGWIAGLLIVGAFWADQALRMIALRYDKEVWLKEKTVLMQLTLLGAACGAATLLNPYGWRLYDMFHQVMKDPFLTSRIGELAPPDLHFVWVLEGVLLTLAAAALRPTRPRGFLIAAAALLLLHLIYRHWENPWVHTAIALPVFAAAAARLPHPGRLAHALLVCFFGFEGIHHVRHLSLLGVVVLPMLAWSLEAWSLALRAEDWRLNDRRSPEPLAWILLGGLAIFWTFFGIEGRSHFQRNLMLLRGVRWEPGVVINRSDRKDFQARLPQGFYQVEGFPEPAVNFLLRAQLPGRLWNGGNYAGYLIWRLAPETYKLFTDNRYDVYGGQFIREEQSVREGWTREFLEQRGATHEKGYYAWDEVLDRWKIQTLFVDGTEKINTILGSHPEWAVVYEDYSFSLWVRNTPENHEIIERARTLARPLPLRIGG